MSLGPPAWGTAAPTGASGATAGGPPAPPAAAAAPSAPGVRARLDPAGGVVDGVERRQQQVAPLAERSVAPPAVEGRAEQAVKGGLLGRRRRQSREPEIHGPERLGAGGAQRITQRFDPHR